MQQYVEAKKKHPDCVIMFRMGDFYEMFFEDAKIAARELDIVLTSRGKVEGKDIPLAGIPYHALDAYLARLVKKGYKLAICEQIEDPKMAKGVVKRDVVRVITPGTIMESSLLDPTANHYLVGLTSYQGKYGIAVADITTGSFATTHVGDREQLLHEIFRLDPREIIADVTDPLLLESLVQRIPITQRQGKLLELAKHSLQGHFGVLSLQGFGLEEMPAAILAVDLLLSYIQETQKRMLAHFTTLKSYSIGETMELDQVTIRNLELLETLFTKKKQGSLLGVLDHTLTSMGARLLRSWICRPLKDVEKIRQRLDAVDEIKQNSILRNGIRKELKQVADLERLISRVSYGNAFPSDLLLLKQSLLVLPELKRELMPCHAALLQQLSHIAEHREIIELLHASIKDNPASTLREGNLIKEGFHQRLDELRKLKGNAAQAIAALEEEEKTKTGIKSLKIGFNRVFGYYLEVSKPNLHLVPQHYIRKQTQLNAERFITESLKEMESDILSAEEKIFALEYELYMGIVDELAKHTKEIQETAQQLAILDVLASFAEIALRQRYVKPEISDGYALSIMQSRHPVLEQLTEYIPNDCVMDEESRTFIITGPNMAGKSSYMRQVAIIVLMAQIGCFVPAQSAKMGVADRIFTRVGAFDDLTAGQSTFMLEMTETANILNNATQKSLIIMDEMGRGTSTFDGVSIAWSVVEYVTSRIKAKMLFATHYHVLNTLAEKYPVIKNYNVAVLEQDEKITFLHKMLAGGTDKSYGIHVAQLAGMPPDVVERAKELQALQMQEENKLEAVKMPSRQKSLLDGWGG